LIAGTEQGDQAASLTVQGELTPFRQIDAISIEELDLLYKIPNSVPVSSKEWWNIDELIEKMWERLDMVRVYGCFSLQYAGIDNHYPADIPSLGAKRQTTVHQLSSGVAGLRLRIFAMPSTRKLQSS
jgi:ribosome-interacting GTPase 1